MGFALESKCAADNIIPLKVIWWTINVQGSQRAVFKRELNIHHKFQL